MAIAVASASTLALATEGGGTGFTIPKPSGLAVGDLMVVHIGYNSGNNQSGLWTKPSGFTEVATMHNNSSTPVGCYIFWKIATSGDVAASGFQFIPTQQTGVGGGGMLRITGADPTTPIEVTAANSNTNQANPTFTSTSLTPTHVQGLDIIALFAGAISGGVSGYAIATDNPTWTEQYDLATALGVGFDCALATGYRPELTATGSVSVVGGSSSSDWVLCHIHITRSPLAADGNHSLLTMTSHFFAGTVSVGTTASHVLLTMSSHIFSNSTKIISKVWTTVKKGANAVWATRKQ